MTTYKPLSDFIVSKYKDLNIVYLCLHGSYLYGTNTFGSGVDIKGVYLPTLIDLHLGRPKVYTNHFAFFGKLIDISIYPVGHFINMLCDNENIAVEMMYADTHDDGVMIASEGWLRVMDNRWRFLTSEMKEVTGFCKKYLKDMLRSGNLECRELSHLLRVIYQLEQIYNDGGLSFPGVWSKQISEIKKGKHNLIDILDYCGSLLDGVELLASKSELKYANDKTKMAAIVLNALTGGE